MNFDLKHLAFARTLKLGYGERLHPARDWLIIGAVVLVLVLISAGWNIWFFDRVSIEASTSATTAAQGLPSAATLDAVQSVFNDRAAEESKYVSGYQFVDPSK